MLRTQLKTQFLPQLTHVTSWKWRETKVISRYKSTVWPFTICHVNKLWQSCVFGCNPNIIGLKNGVFYE